MEVLHPVVVRDPVPLPTGANIAATRPKFTFTDAQMAIAMAVQTRQMKEAS